MFYRYERLGLFVDGSNFYSAAKSLGFDIDFKKLKNEFTRRSTLLRAYYYTVLAEHEDYSPVRPLVDWLDYNGYTIITKPAKEFIDANGRRRFKGNMDIEISVDALTIAPHVQHIVLCSGNGDFKPLIVALQRLGIRVSVVSSVKSTPPMIADELRRQADNFIELADLEEAVGRSPKKDRVAALDHEPNQDDVSEIPRFMYSEIDTNN